MEIKLVAVKAVAPGHVHFSATWTVALKTTELPKSAETFLQLRRVFYQINRLSELWFPLAPQAECSNFALNLVIAEMCSGNLKGSAEP